MAKVFAPSVPVTPAVLFYQFHVDMLMLPSSGGKRYCLHARESLTGYPEALGVLRENTETIAQFLFQHVLCQWGPVAELIMDNGGAFVKAVEYLSARYSVHHIQISGYNSRANGVIERRHLNLGEQAVKLLVESCAGWDVALPAMLWAERATMQKATGYSPFQMVTGQELVLPFDLTEATWLVEGLDAMSTKELLAVRARQLQQREADLAGIRERVRKVRLASIQEFEKLYAGRVKDFNCPQGSLVLVRNKRVEMELDRKTKPRYYGPMVVLRQGCNGAYELAELDGAVSRNCFVASRIVPYHARSMMSGKFIYDLGRTVCVPQLADVLNDLLQGRQGAGVGRAAPDETSDRETDLEEERYGADDLTGRPGGQNNDQLTTSNDEASFTSTAVYMVAELGKAAEDMATKGEWMPVAVKLHAGIDAKDDEGDRARGGLIMRPSPPAGPPRARTLRRRLISH